MKEEPCRMEDRIDWNEQLDRIMRQLGICRYAIDIARQPVGDAEPPDEQRHDVVRADDHLRGVAVELGARDVGIAGIAEMTGVLGHAEVLSLGRGELAEGAGGAAGGLRDQGQAGGDGVGQPAGPAGGVGTEPGAGFGDGFGGADHRKVVVADDDTVAVGDAGPVQRADLHGG